MGPIRGRGVSLPMIRKFYHIVLLLIASLISGCTSEVVPSREETNILLTVRCDAPTKSDPEEKEGEQSFNENLIRSVDFLFYPGSEPSETTDAVLHIRKELASDPMQPGKWEVDFDLVVKKDMINAIFKEYNNYMATVYALVNFDESFIDDWSKTSRADLLAKRMVTDFAQEESQYIQPCFLMDGLAVVHYDADALINVDATIDVKRFASKLTLALNVAEEVTLRHTDGSKYPDPEVWEPVYPTMRVYLMDGVKSVVLTHDKTLPDAKPIDPEPEYFSYNAANRRRPYVRENGTAYLNKEVVDEKEYFTTWPMYSYPSKWNITMPDHSEINYANGLPPEPPYFKLEMDWRRKAVNGYDYDRRKYYYKIVIPTDELKRNSWYGLYVDVSILGAESDEGKAVLEPTCYLLDWQNKAMSINKYAVISKARYLSVDKATWDINNMETLTIPFLSSHNVTVVKGSVKATRPYYGEIKGSQPVNSYHQNFHGWIRKKGENSYYLEYTGQPSGKEAWEPSNWLSNTSTAIVLNHPLVNNFSDPSFDYSPYTIEFDIVHTDLTDDTTSHTYSQYLRHITIVQRPGIYIERLTNSDTEICRRNPSETSAQGLYGYPDGEEPWTDKPWGYVYVNGGRIIRHETTSHTGTEDYYYTDLSSENKQEYQWQTVWYTGGSKDIWDIHATVLPSTTNFVIGDPRREEVNNLDDPVEYRGLYEFTVGGKNREAKWKDVLKLETIRSGSTEYKEVSDGVWTRTGFNEADALYGDEPVRSLKWYYPTDKTTRTDNMLAPSYRISSKFSGIEFGNLNIKYAEYRCAAYQEDGFPAGRWRLPTKAEVHFISQLSARGFFEFLFNNGSIYWSANGAIKINGDKVENSNSQTALLRCVYDSWYWDKIDGLEGDPRRSDKTVFYWGDKER